jgi:hypothetical protein
MSSYRSKRRTFLAGLGSAFGLEVLLGNLEAAAEGAPPPQRLLVMHWPLGTLRKRFLPEPTGSGNGFTASPLLAPFEDAGLHDDMIVLYGLSFGGLTGMGGGNESGTVYAMTGASSPGTRSNGGESDDSVAGGPSFDQIFLRHFPELQRPGRGYANAIADARVFSYETSTQCLSYDYQQRQVESARPGGILTEHMPLLPELSPFRLYSNLFASFVPDGDITAALKALRTRKSVLDSVLRELARLRSLAPASERVKIDAHGDAVRRAELELEAAIERAQNEPQANCAAPDGLDPELKAKSGSAPMPSNFGKTDMEDASFVERVGKLHASVIRAAFQCDLIRVATLQWCPSNNHVAFAGMDPEDPDAIYEMGAYQYRSTDSAFFDGDPPSGQLGQFYETLSNMYLWFKRNTAAVLSDLKAAPDPFGGNLLDSTIVPFITEESNAADNLNSLPALVFGGRALGMRGGQFMNLSPTRPFNDLWMTIAQAYLKSDDPLPEFAEEAFVKTNVSPIPGLWAPPD